MKLLSAILFAGLIAGGCATGAAIDTTTVTAGTGPPITAITTDYEGSWSQGVDTAVRHSGRLRTWQRVG